MAYFKIFYFYSIILFILLLFNLSYEFNYNIKCLNGEWVNINDNEIYFIKNLTIKILPNLEIELCESYLLLKNECYKLRKVFRHSNNEVNVFFIFIYIKKKNF